MSQNLQEAYKNATNYNLHLILKYYSKFFVEQDPVKRESLWVLIKRLQRGV